MWTMVWPILLLLVSNMLYHICQKNVPEQANVFASLTVTYLISTVLTALLFVISAKPQNLATELGKINGSSMALGVVLVIIEAAWIFAYRNGWKVSVASLTVNIGLACLLLFVGLLLYHESLSLRQLVGMLVCAAGLILING